MQTVWTSRTLLYVLLLAITLGLMLLLRDGALLGQ